MTDADASRDEKLTAAGSFFVLVGLVVLVVAVLAFIAALV
jgi:hypothetical protein